MDDDEETQATPDDIRNNY